MIKQKLYWIAGLLEGEGCFTKRANGTIHGKITVMCQMTDVDILHKLSSYIGGKVRGPYSNGYGLRKKNKDRYSWQIHGKAAYLLMKSLYPLMGNRRRSRILELTKEYESFSPKTYKFENIKTGEIHTTLHAREWYRKQGLPTNAESGLYRTMTGERNSYLGWKRLK